MPNELTEANACASPFYEDGVANAVRRARENPGACFSVYYDGEDIFVRASEAAPPPNALLICIAQRWDAATIQLRFHGARSEWRNA